MRTHIARLIAAASVTSLLGGCDDEFTSGPTTPLSVEQESTWKSTLTVSDTAVLQFRLVHQDYGAVEAPLATWRSSDEDIVRIEPLPANTGNAVADSLAARRTRVRVIALDSGAVTISVSIDRSTGSDPERTFPIRVNPVHFEKVTWSDTLAVSDQPTLSVRLVNSLGEPVGSRNVVFSSSVDSIVRMNQGTVVLAGGVYSNTGSAGARGPVAISARAIGPDGAVVTTFTAPIRVMERWVQVVGYANKTCGLTVRGFAYCWGARVGSSDFNFDKSPTLVRSPFSDAGVRFSSLQGGENHICGEGATTPGIWYCWGKNNLGQLTTGATFDEPMPTPMRMNGLILRSLSISDRVSCGLGPDVTDITVDSTLAFCWGQLISAIGAPRANPGTPGPSIAFGWAGCFRPGLRDKCPGYHAVSVGSLHACALVRGEAIFGVGVAPSDAVGCWGDNGAGQLGPAATSTSTGPFLVIRSQIPIGVKYRFSALATTINASCVVDLGTLRCWGGRFGTTPVDPLSGTPVSAIAANPGSAALCAVGRDNGWVYCMSTATGGSTAIGTTNLAEDNRALRFQSVMVAGRAVGPTAPSIFVSNHFCGITVSEGAMYCWGRNDMAQLGNGFYSVDFGGPIGPRRVIEPLP